MIVRLTLQIAIALISLSIVEDILWPYLSSTAKTSVVSSRANNFMSKRIKSKSVNFKSKSANAKRESARLKSHRTDFKKGKNSKGNFSTTEKKPQQQQQRLRHLIYFNRIPKTGSMTTVEIFWRARHLHLKDSPFRTFSSKIFFKYNLLPKDQVCQYATVM